MTSHPKLFNIRIKFALTTPYFVIWHSAYSVLMSPNWQFFLRKWSCQTVENTQSYLSTSSVLFVSLSVRHANVYGLAEVVCQFASSLCMTKTPKSRFVQSTEADAAKCDHRSWQFERDDCREFLSHFCKTDFKVGKQCIGCRYFVRDEL